MMDVYTLKVLLLRRRLLNCHEYTSQVQPTSPRHKFKKSMFAQGEDPQQVVHLSNSLTFQ